MSKNLLAKNLLLSDNFWTLNKTVVKELGIEATIMLTVFAEAESMLADKEGWFFQTIETIEEMTTLSRHKQTQAIKKLQESKLLEQINKGQPMKRYFRINYKVLENIFKKESHPSMSKIDKLVCNGQTSQYVKNSQTKMSNIDKLVCEKSATSKESTYKEHINKESTKHIVVSKNETTKDNPHKLIFNEWVKADIVKHRSLTSKMKTAINSALRDYELETILQSIRNYKTILNNDNYYFDHKWTLDYFLKRGLGSFEHLEIAKQNFIKRGLVVPTETKESTTKEVSEEFTDEELAAIDKAWKEMQEQYGENNNE